MRRGWGGGTRDRTAAVASWANDEAAAFGWVWPPSCFFLEGVEIIRIPTQRSVKALLCTDTRRIALRAIGSGIRVRGNEGLGSDPVGSPHRLGPKRTLASL